MRSRANRDQSFVCGAVVGGVGAAVAAAIIVVVGTIIECPFLGDADGASRDSGIDADSEVDAETALLTR